MDGVVGTGDFQLSLSRHELSRVLTPAKGK
jgi:hypothetical protein